MLMRPPSSAAMAILKPSPSCAAGASEVHGPATIYTWQAGLRISQANCPPAELA